MTHERSAFFKNDDTPRLPATFPADPDKIHKVAHFRALDSLPGAHENRRGLIVDKNVKVSYYKAGQSPHVVLAHELTHAVHYLKGVAYKNKAMEEAQTVGLYPFSDEKYTENKFRGELMNTGFRGAITKGFRSKY